MRVFLITGLLTLMATSVGFAASCEQSFKTEGVPLLTPTVYRATQSFTGVKTSDALQRMAQAIAADGFSGIKINKQLSSIDAYQDGSGSGRMQTLRVTARKQGKAIRVDAVFTLKVGQTMSTSVARKGLCGFIAAAAK